MFGVRWLFNDPQIVPLKKSPVVFTWREINLQNDALFEEAMLDCVVYFFSIVQELLVQCFMNNIQRKGVSIYI